MTQNKYFEKSLPISIQIFQKISIFISFSEFHSKIWKKVYQKRSETPRFLSTKIHLSQNLLPPKLCYIHIIWIRYIKEEEEEKSLPIE